MRDSFRPTEAQGAPRLITRFWSLSLPTASPEAFDTFAKDYKATLAALKTAKVDLETIYSSHLLNALPASLSSLQTSLAVANQSTPRPDAILEVVRNEILRTAPSTTGVALLAARGNDSPPPSACPACKGMHWLRECDPKKRDEYRAKQSKQRKERAAARLATSTPPAPPSSLAPTGPTAALAELLETDACVATPACSPRSAHARLRPWGGGGGLSGKNGLKVTGVGSLSVKLTGGRVVKINRALLVPGITVNLVSTSQLYDLHGVTTTFGKDAILSRNGQVVATGSRLTSNLYRLNGALVDPSAAEGAYALLASGSATIELTTWHRRFAHLSLRSIDALARSKHVTGLKVYGSGRSKTSGSHVCNVCHVARSSRLPFPRSDSIASTPLELVHSDVLSINVPSLSGRRYVVTFVDDHTRMLWVEPLARKSDVFEAFVRFKAKVENESGRRIQRFRSDNGGEYMSRTFDDMLAEHGIIRESPPPYSPQSNGVAERVNRSIVEGIVSLLAQAGAPKTLWAEALQAFVFVKNRSPHAALSGNVPLAVWRNRPARVDMLRTWGCRAWHTVTNGRSKLDDRAIPLIFVGYDGDTAAYRLFDPVTRKTIRSRDTRFVEDEFPLLASRTAESSPSAQAIEPADIVVTAARDDPPLGEWSLMRATTPVERGGGGGGVHHYIALHIDDLLSVSPSLDEIARVKAGLKEEYGIKNLGAAKHPDPPAHRRFPLPLATRGSLMYAMLGTRIDLAHVVGVLGCHAAHPDNTHWAAVLRALLYIRGTLDYGLEYMPDLSPLRGFEAYSDSNWGACPTSSRLTMGDVFLLANGPSPGCPSLG
ncbi:gag-Pol polyprotein [Rhodotorula toruloides]|uniref:Gag-Pol polyprotein n=1 Tax=Rhodotorula toruloides TaxID=5286 RepID=A0A511KGG1_RHOTO|nr:gag-Pol polyprotein [Rhodotorula toruloides]